MIHASLFTGIGGFDLAAQWAGFTNSFMVEKDAFCQKVLAKNFPQHAIYGDIKQFNEEEAIKYRGTIDIISGGFPCQPFSVAGKRAGSADDRSLWYEMFRTIRIIQPSYVLGENVSGLLTIEDVMVFEGICTDLENEGYEVQAFIIPAIAIDAPHRRDRLWIVAHSQDIRRNRRDFDREWVSKKDKTEEANTSARPNQALEVALAYSESERLQGQKFIRQSARDAQHFERDWLEVATRICGMHDGVSRKLDKYRSKRIEKLGNAIVPQVAYPIFKAIEYTDQLLYGNS